MVCAHFGATHAPEPARARIVRCRRTRIAELEARFPRTGFRNAAMQLARAEARRVPEGRFAFFRWIFPIVLR